MFGVENFFGKKTLGEAVLDKHEKQQEIERKSSGNQGAARIPTRAESDYARSQRLMDKHYGLPSQNETRLEKFMDHGEWVDKAHPSEMPPAKVEAEKKIELTPSQKSLANGAAAMFDNMVLKNISDLDEGKIKREVSAIKKFMEDRTGSMAEFQGCNQILVEQAFRYIDRGIGNNGLTMSKAEFLKAELEKELLGIKMSNAGY